MIMRNEEFKKLEVDKKNDVVSYNDEVHAYWTTDGLMKCISATTLIGMFSTFDGEFWSRYKALEAVMGVSKFKDVKPRLLATKKFDDEILAEFNIDKDVFETKLAEILAEWDEKRDTACARGTDIHLGYELKTLEQDYAPLKKFGFKGFDGYTIDTSNIIKEGQYVIPEMLISRISEDGILRVAGQADLVVVNGNKFSILDYKGLALDTPIMTTKGFKMLEFITKEDIIYDKEGKETEIVNISEVHYNPCYKITFDNGESIVADHEHRWLISFARGKGKFKDLVLTTEELKNSLELYKESKNNRLLPKIKNALPLEGIKKELPIDPYILGAWLGDGTAVAGSITNVNQDFWDEVVKRGYTYGENIGGPDRAELRTIFGLRTELGKLNLLSNKHIPSEYLTASYEQRLDLLRGFMDADGYYNPKRKRHVMSTTRERQADYLITLLATLGVKPSKIYAQKQCGDKRYDGWDVCFTMKDNPFLIRNQTCIEFPKTDKSSFRVIKEIELVETVPTKCLEVNSVSHTFLAGYGLLPTHNTNKEIKTKSFFDRAKRSSTRMKYPLNNLDDVNFWHYTLQLSLYAWMILKANPHMELEGLYLLHHDHDDNKEVYKCEYKKTEVERMLAYYKQQIQYKQHKERNAKPQ